MRCVAVFLILFCSCAAEDLEITFDPCSPLTVVAASGTRPDEVDGIEEALAMWSRVLPTQIVVTDDPMADGLRVVFESGDTFYRALYFDSLGEIWISRDHPRAAYYVIALAHELGHAFGLLHVSADLRPSVMNQGNIDISPTSEDAAEVRALWEACD